MKKQILFASMLMACGAAQVYADDNTYDPRSLGMGGTGVTTSSMTNAAFQNPAMLASTSTGSFAWEFPIVSARLQDQTQLHSDVKTMSTDATNLTNALTTFANDVNTSSPNTQADALTAANALNVFNADMQKASDRTLMVDAFAGTMMGFPGKTFALSVYYDARAEVGALFNYTQGDAITVSTLANDLTLCSQGNLTNCNNANAAQTNGKVNNLTSSLNIRGMLDKELGITVAHHYDSLGGLDIGITPKFQKIATYDFSLNPQQNNNNITLNSGEQDYTAFNLDMGVVKQMSDEVRVGMVTKNILKKSFTTVNGNTLDVKPQATVGASYTTAHTTTGLDLDVIANKPVITGYSKDSQYIRIGTELRTGWNVLKVRLGYRHDLKNNYPNLPSAGLALQILGLHIDLSAAYANQKEAAASAQLGFDW